MGVPVFFVLSGYLISYTVFKNPDQFDVLSYAARRFGKIAPPYILSLIVFAGLLFFWKHPGNLVASVFAYATTWAHFQRGWADINGVYWSLMIEMHFYVVLPLLFFGLKRVSRYPDWLTFFVFLLIPPVVRFFSHFPFYASLEIRLVYENLFPRALDNFALGILFSIIQIRFRNHPSITRIAAAVAASGVFLMLATYCLYAFLEWKFGVRYGNTIPTFEMLRFLPELSTFCLLFVVFTPQQNVLNRILSWPVLGFIGLISYEWFLFHMPPAQFLADIVGKSHGDLSNYLVKAIIPFATTFCASAFIYFYMSAPILSKIKGQLKARKQRILDQAGEASPAQLS